MARRHASRADRIGLRAAMADRLLPFMVAAMSFLAALALAGSVAAGALAAHWLSGAQGLTTVEVPDPLGAAAMVASGSAPAKAGWASTKAGWDPAKAAAPPAKAGVASTKAGSASTKEAAAPLRQDAVMTLLQAETGLSDAHLLSKSDLATLLKPWLGDAAADGSLPVALPAVIVVRADAAGVQTESKGTGEMGAKALEAQLDAVAPGTLVDSGARWADRLAALTTCLRASAAAVLLIVALVAASVVAVAVRAGLSQRREAIEIIHGLGALDSDIANQFAIRAMRLAATGGLVGGVVALPVLAWLALLSAGFVTSAPAARGGVMGVLPPLLWAMPVMFTLATAVIGWVAAQVTVRGWLKRLA